MSAAVGKLVAFVDGIGLAGPGLAGWSASADVVAGRAPHVSQPTILVPPSALPPAERRRVGRGVKVALDVAFAAAADAGRDPATLASVFTSSSGDGDNCDAICRELAGDRLISPTRFHNSVHNAPAGYWGIASGSMRPSTSLCAYDDSFAAGLDDALTQLADAADAVLVVAYDAPYPEPLRSARPTPDSFGVALVLAREPGPRTLARLDVVAADAAEATRMPQSSLEALRRDIPAARALPLLATIAGGGAADVVVAQANGTALVLSVAPLAAHADPRRSACG